MSILNTTIVKRNSSLLQANDEENFIVLDPQTNLIYSLNETAQLIWNFTENKKKVEEIIQYVSEEYNISHDQIKEDIISLLREYSPILFELKENPRPHSTK